MKLGKFKIEFIDAGNFALDGGAMFGVIPKPLWEKTNPSDEANRIKLAARLMLIEWDNEKLLIDTGMGDKWDEKSKKIYDIHTDISLEKELAKKGLTTGQITKVLLTHLHFDHAGGNTKNVKGKILPTFPNAQYYVRKQNFEWALSPSERDIRDYMHENFVPLAEEGVLTLLEDRDTELAEGIILHELNGHTFGHQCVQVTDGSQSLFYCADLFPTYAHVPLPYIMGFDLQPLITLQDKKKILTKAIEEDWTLVLQHDPDIPAIKVEKTEKGFGVKEKIYSL
ncbi:MAG: MBL fold metallo-hydrolase [Ignavibacteria bacterium]|nr:MBL fold metallo-hydrolase [Ignavibacteria bacterium]